MSLIWDEVGSRTYESGVDRGVLYLPDGSAIPWNGLTSVVEHSGKEDSPIYFDGMKINVLVSSGDFSASMTAITYPDEFSEIEGLGFITPGVFYANQTPKSFGLSYRTMIGNDVEGDSAGYKIHVLYNVIAVPSDKSYSTMSAESTPSQFEWEISAVPEEISGFRPTAHIIIDSREVHPILLEELETILYSTETPLIPMAELAAYINDWYIIKIVDHGDGTWSAITDYEELIVMTSPTQFEILDANAIYLDADTYEISDTN